jgi:hypothetical protein
MTPLSYPQGKFKNFTTKAAKTAKIKIEIPWRPLGPLWFDPEFLPHHEKRPRSHSATARGSKRTADPIRKLGMRPALAIL